MKTLARLMQIIDSHATHKAGTSRDAVSRALAEALADSARLDAIELMAVQPGGLLIYDEAKPVSTASTTGLALNSGAFGSLRQVIDERVQHIEL